MIHVDHILQLHQDTVALWHHQPLANPYEGWLQVVCQQHQYNYELWHQEDIARSPDVDDKAIAGVKRAIDRLNQLRNDWIEKLDDWITEKLSESNIIPAESAKQNTETPGSCIDRLSILALRLYHLREQLERTDVDQKHLDKVQQRLAIGEAQRRDLSQGLRELVEDLLSGKKRHRTYRQMKMYNDPTMNPYLYQARDKQLKV
jgi:hypothetical protein